MSIFTQLYKSLYSPKEIARFRFQKIGKTILYILLLALLSTVPQTLQIGSLITDQLAILEQTVDAELPDFTIANGELQSNTPEAIIKEEDDFTFVFDPNSVESPISPSAANGMFLLKENVMIISNGETQSYPYSSLSEFTLSKTDIQDFLGVIKGIYPIALFVIGVFLFIFNAFISVIGITILAFAGRFFSSQMKRRLQYKQLWTLTAYSFTIPTIFFIVMESLHTVVPYSLLIFIFVSLFVLYLTLKEVPPPKAKASL